MLMRFDPFKDFERWAHQLSGGTRYPAMTLDAYRQGDHWVAAFDLPGVDPSSIDVTVEKDVLTVRAERSGPQEEGVEVLAAERPHGTFTRQLYLGDGLDAEHIEASYEAGVGAVDDDNFEASLHEGVLTVGVPKPLGERPRRIPVLCR